MTVRTEGASVIVAGASGGLGTAIARELHRRGALLTLTGRDRSRLDAVGVADAQIVTADLRDERASVEIIDAALARHGRIDGLVYAAGRVAFGPLAETTPLVIEELFAINSVAPLAMVAATIPHLPRGGFVAIVSAVVAERPLPGMVAYSASKAAVTAADHALARELRAAGIHVLDARPPHTETGLADRPLAGTPPALPEGADPQAIAHSIVAAVAEGRRDLAASELDA